MSREPIRWTQRGRDVGYIVQVLSVAAGLYGAIWAVAILGGAL